MYRKGVSALILNKKNEILLVNLNSFKEHFFAIPGGGIEPGETYDEAVYRELQEELGLSKKVLEFIGKSDNPIKNKFKTIKLDREGKEYDGFERYFFGFKFSGQNTDITINKNEVRSFRWVSLDKLKDFLLFEQQLEQTIEQILELFEIETSNFIKD